MVFDNSGEAWERVRVLSSSRVVSKVDTPLHHVARGKTYSTAWRVPSGLHGLRFCVQAWDSAGNASKQSCAALRLQ